ncbi:MAG TPA: polysaccharide deacetylase family protein [Vicinamibacterales bacterium]|nr:polysaccharide deacetylase family protein [Vicinamibacterales bacterium]
MSTVELIPVRVASIGSEYACASWAEGRRFNVPADLPAKVNWRVSASGELSVGNDALPVPPGAIPQLRNFKAFTDDPPASARLPVSYQHVPGGLRAVIGSMIGRWNRGRSDRWAKFPAWPLDLSADLLFDLSAKTNPRSAGKAPVILTHDIDSSEGLQSLVDRFLPIEEAAGARSTSYVVPCAWPVDDGLVGEISRRGHDVGVHGYDHSNLTPFASAEERRRRLDAAKPFADRHRAAGYRAPSLLRTRELLRDLSGRYRYDSSIPTSGGLFPVPNNGCASARPFLVEGILELPLSMPRDGSLRFLGYSAGEIARLWIDCADLIQRSEGVIVLLTHCERRFSGNDAMLTAYRQFLDHVTAHPERFAFQRATDVVDRVL